MGVRNDESVQHVAVNEKGMKLIGVRQNKLYPIEFYRLASENFKESKKSFGFGKPKKINRLFIILSSWSKIVSVLASKSSSTTTDIATITLGNGQKLSLHCECAINLQRTCDTFFMNDVKSSSKRGPGAANNYHQGHQSDHSHGHINMMKSAATMQNNQSRVMAMGMAHHQIQSTTSAGGSYGDEMDSTIGIEFTDDVDEISNTPTGGQMSHTHTHFSRKMVSSSYYDHNGGEEDEQMMDFNVSFPTFHNNFMHPLSTVISGTGYNI